MSLYTQQCRETQITSFHVRNLNVVPLQIDSYTLIHYRHCLTLWRLHLIFFFTLMSVLYDVQMDHYTARNTKVLKLCGLYQDINDWISPLNKQSGRPFIRTQQSMRRNEYGISGHLHILAFLKHLMVLLRCNFFQGFTLHLISKTLIPCRDM